MEQNWQAVQKWLGGLLADRGVDRIVAEELTVPPGIDEVFSLLKIKQHVESGEFDAIIVDCAPTGETLRLLSFPDVARWWLEKVFPWEKRLIGAARPLAKTFLDIPLPSSDVFADVQRLMRNLIAMNEILRDRDHATIRLVMNPERMVIKEAQRTFTYLNLYGFVTDAVVINRVFPADVEGGYFAAWRERAAGARRARPSRRSRRCRCCSARSSTRRWSAPQMLEQAGRVGVRRVRPAASCSTASLSQELVMNDEGAQLRLKVPFVEKAEHRPEEDRAGAGDPDRRPEAQYHAAIGDGPLPAARCEVRRRGADRAVRAGTRRALRRAGKWKTPSHSPDGLITAPSASSAPITSRRRSSTSASSSARSAARPTSCARRCRRSSTSSGRASSATPW